MTEEDKKDKKDKGKKIKNTSSSRALTWSSALKGEKSETAARLIMSCLTVSNGISLNGSSVVTSSSHLHENMACVAAAGSKQSQGNQQVSADLGCEHRFFLAALSL